MSETKQDVLTRLFSYSVCYKSLVQKDALEVRNQSDEVGRVIRELNNAVRNESFTTPRVKLFETFLGKDISEQSVTSKIYPKYKKPTVCVSAEKIITTECQKVKTYNFTACAQENLDIPVHENVETDIDTSQKALVLGFVTLTYQDKRFIIGIDFIQGWKVGYINVYSLDKDEKLASDLLDKIEKWAKYNNFLFGKKINVSGQFLRLDNLGWDDIILPDSLKREIKTTTVDLINKKELYKKNKVPIKRGILMSGPPGVGKTLIAKVLCNTVESTFIWVTSDDITEYYGAEDIKNIYDMARELAPTLVLFEDIDYIGRNREKGHFNRITGELLNQLDGVESNEGIITLASSNFPEVLDIALRDRPGRFDRRIVFELPDEECRGKMLTYFTSNVLLSDNIDMDSLVEDTLGLTGAHIKELVTTAIILAIDSGSLQDEQAIVKMEHFTSSLKRIREQKDILAQEKQQEVDGALSDKTTDLKRLFGDKGGKD